MTHTYKYGYKALMLGYHDGKYFVPQKCQKWQKYKALMLGYHDGKSFFALDLSLHGEAGKDGKYLLNSKQRKAQYKKKREAGNPDKVRRDEYFSTKTDNLMTMIRRAIEKGVRFDFLLVDSWFTCKELVRFIKTRT